MRDDRVYVVRLTKTESMQIEQMQTMFMSSVFSLAQKFGLIGNGLEITLIDEVKS